MKYYILAGEASGDLHGSHLIKALKQNDARAILYAWGGDKMQSAGALIRKHYRELAFMGFIEVIQNIGTILKNFNYCKKDIAEFKPDALILIDYPGFNLRMASWAKKNGYKVFYYISPQVWAWKADRVKIIRSSVDKMYTILPFENEWYSKYKVYPKFVGHPLLEELKSFVPDASLKNKYANKKIIALLPGSRKQEISKMLPVYLQAVKSFQDYTPVIAAAPSQSIGFYQSIIKEMDIDIVQNKTYEILSIASLAWVSSGTATLETALFNVPQVVCYKGNSLSYYIARRLVNVQYISLVNLILERPVIPELIQFGFTAETLIKTTQELNLNQIKEDYSRLYHLLLPDNASEQVAHSIINEIQ